MIYKVFLSAVAALSLSIPLNCSAGEALNDSTIAAKTPLGIKINQGMINEAIKILQPAINNSGSNSSKNKPNNTRPGNGGAPINAAQFQQEVLRLVNVERAKQGLRPLVTNDDIERSAMVRAKELVINYSHTRPDGSRGISALSYFNTCAAENIAKGYSSPEAVMKGWMSSPGHRSNIMHPQLKELGVGYYYDISSSHKHHWVQLFRG